LTKPTQIDHRLPPWDDQPQANKKKDLYPRHDSSCGE